MDDDQVKKGAFYTTRQAAIRLGYSPLYMSRLVNAGHIIGVKLPFTGPRGRWWIPHNEVERLLQPLEQVRQVESTIAGKPEVSTKQVDEPKRSSKKVDEPKPVDKPKKIDKPKETTTKFKKTKETVSKPKKTSKSRKIDKSEGLVDRPWITSRGEVLRPDQVDGWLKSIDSSVSVDESSRVSDVEVIEPEQVVKPKKVSVFELLGFKEE